MTVLAIDPRVTKCPLKGQAHHPLGLVGKVGEVGNNGAGGVLIRGVLYVGKGCGVFAVPSGKPIASLKKVTLPMFCAVPKGSPFASL